MPPRARIRKPRISFNAVEVTWTEIVVSATTSYSLDTTPATYNITGSSATTLYNRQVDTTPATYDVTGSSVTTLYNRQIDTTPATYDVTGSSATTLYNRQVDTTPATYNFAGSNVVLFPSISRPSSDITVTDWTGDPDNTNLYNNIDEVSASDTDYIISPSLGGSPGPAIFGLNESLAAGTYTVRARARRTGASGEIRALLLDSSGTTVGTGSWQPVTGTFDTYALTVTTSGTAARVRIEVKS